MEKEEYWKLLRMESGSWTIARRELLLYFLEKEFDGKGKILDVGCGMGGNMEFLEKCGYEIFGIDKYQRAVRFCQKRGLRVQAGLAEKMPFEEDSFDALIATDILEHLSKPRKAITEFSRVLNPDGLLIISVPAFNILWSALDNSAHHVKRYTVSLLKSEIKEKFKPVKLSYMFFSAFFPLLFIRLFRRLIRERNGYLLRDQFPTKPKIFEILILWLFRIENILLRRINFPLGVGIIGIFRNSKSHRSSV